MSISRSTIPSMTRRQFTLASAAAMATRLAPPLLAQSSDKPVGYAIIGLGRIADHFMDGIQHSPNSKVTALVSGHPEKAARYAEKYSVPKSSIYNYENMDSFRNNPDVDAVYVALPNSMHAEYTIRSAKAGKHVLCEKPMCINVHEAHAMIDACNQANVKLMIAYRCHYEPTNLKAVSLIRSGAIGKIETIQSAFGFDIGATEWRLNKTLAGGGPLMDVGIYCLNATRYLTGEEPTDLKAFAFSDPADPRFRQVEENLVWTTKFPSGALASCNTTYGSQMDGYFHVYGSKGWIEARPSYNYDGLHLRAAYRDASGKWVSIDEPNLQKDPYQFTAQANHFSHCVRHNQTPKTPGEEGLRDMEYITRLYSSAGIQMLA